MHNLLHSPHRPALSIVSLILIAPWLLVRPGVSQGQTTAPSDEYTRARYRVIIDNDFGGDPDGLFALAIASGHDCAVGS